MKRTFTRAEAREIVWGNHKTAKVIEDTIIGTRRWSIDHCCIFSLDGKFYSVTYSVGATEQQDESPFEYDDTVEATEVRRVERIATFYEAVEEGAQAPEATNA